MNSIEFTLIELTFFENSDSSTSNIVYFKAIIENYYN